MSQPQMYEMFIDGSWVSSSSGEVFSVINPATERQLAKVPMGTIDDVRKAIDAARAAFEGGWRSKTAAERSVLIWKLADLIEKDADRLAAVESANVGKTIKYARESDLPFIVDNLRFFAGAARTMEGKAVSEYSGMGTSMIRREPLGVVGAIIPWNYPAYIATWKVAPALAAGNTIVLKPASLTPLSLLEFAKLTEKAGIPRGVFNVVTGPGDVIGSELAGSNKVDMVALTGDTETGRKIMKSAASNIKRVHLELGGKAPMVVLPDADVETVAQGAVVGGFWNTGQDCTAVTRVIVHDSIYEDVVGRMAEKARQFKVGDPSTRSTDMGPLVSARQRETVEKFVNSGVDDGAVLAAGGARPKGLKRGFFYQPTIFRDADQSMEICREEIFGPVIAVYPYSSVDNAVEDANDVDYGLAASVYGKDITQAVKVANSLDFGTVWINEHGVLTSEMPHGGFKQSGFGKDLSLYSLEEYTRVKHVYVDLTGKAVKPWHSAILGKS